MAVYDGIWFAVPIAALVMCIVDPDAARDVVVSVQAFTQRNSRTIILVTSFVAGVALIVRGLLAV